MNVFDVLREKLETESQTIAPIYDMQVKVISLEKIKEIVNQVEKEYNNGWIACTVNLPPQPSPNPEFENKPLEIYMVSVKHSKYPFCVFWNGKFFTDGFNEIYPTAWQPLPPKYGPKGE